ncbi:hypothetical protein EHS25_008619 [Saitozyma podzolica]|uniref:Uncharacterized protein n=1 Tax=Saitozyma podzolica TaxID=1890683 RepID=A0A427YM65_9TREE|nr:hypothetical protein EHS25_008619 [Saitozyma podzolica]
MLGDAQTRPQPQQQPHLDLHHFAHYTRHLSHPPTGPMRPRIPRDGSYTTSRVANPAKQRSYAYTTATSVASDLKHLGRTPAEIRRGVNALNSYVAYKRDRGRSNLEIGAKLAALQIMVPDDLGDIFDTVRQLCQLPAHRPHALSRLSQLREPEPLPQRIPRKSFLPSIHSVSSSSSGDSFWSEHSSDNPSTPPSPLIWHLATGQRWRPPLSEFNSSLASPPAIIVTDTDPESSEESHSHARPFSRRPSLTHRSHPSFDSLGEGLLDSFPLPPPRARDDERSKTPTPAHGTWPHRIARVERAVDALQSDIWDWESDDRATITAATARGRPLSSWSGVFESMSIPDPPGEQIGPSAASKIRDAYLQQNACGQLSVH